MTQFDLAHLALVDQMTISRLELLRNPPIAATAERLARALDTDVENLYSAEPDLTRLSERRRTKRTAQEAEAR